MASFKTALVKFLFVKVSAASIKDSVPLTFGAVRVLVVLPDIPEHSKANCFVLSELSLILNPLSSVTMAADVIDVTPVIVARLLPKATLELPIVTELLANLALGIAFVPISPEV
jgi:hypothetical protein